MRNRKTGRRLWACLPALLVALFAQWPVFAAEPVAAAGKPADFRSQNFLVHTDVPVVNTNDLEIELLGVAVLALCVLENMRSRLCFGCVSLYRRLLLERSRRGFFNLHRVL